jgi:hypothetical protein
MPEDAIIAAPLIPDIWFLISESTSGNHFIVGMTNSAPERMPVGQREVTVLSLV